MADGVDAQGTPSNLNYAENGNQQQVSASYFQENLELLNNRLENSDSLSLLLSREGASEESAQLILFASDEGKLNVGLILYILGHMSENDVIDENGSTPLLRASKNGHLGYVKLFINQRNADFKRKDNFGMSALSWAAKSGHLEIVNYLIQNGCDVNVLDMENKTPLTLAIEGCKWDIVNCLVSRGADVSVVDKNGNAVLHQVIKAGNWDMVRHLVSMGADVNVVDSNNISPIQYAADCEQWDAVKCMVQNKAKITPLKASQKQKLLDCVNEESENEYREFYHVIRLGNTDLLNMLIRSKVGSSDSELGDPNVLATVEPYLSEAYEELKLKNVPLSPEIEFDVQDKIINCRFYAEPNDFNNQLVKATLEDVVARIDMICSQIRHLNQVYSGEEGKGLDDEFFLIIRFVAQNIRVLKRQLKSTYNKLPWEEMEFCLTSFLLIHCKPTISYSIYKLVLDQDKIVSYLDHFSSELNRHKLNLTKSDINSKFPKKQTPTLSTRNDAIKSVIANNSSFQSMCDDHDLIRNVYSLQRIDFYINLALSVNVDDKKDLGKLVIERALQVIGESLKNTIESPNVSDNIYEMLLLSAPKNVKEIITSLRDSLSHTYSLRNKIELEDMRGDAFFREVKSDLVKIGVEIRDILSQKKLDIIRLYAEKITNSETLEDMKKLGLNAAGVPFEKVESDAMKGENGLQKMKKMVEVLSSKIEKQTDDERMNFERIYNAINSQLSKVEEGKSDLAYAVLSIRGLSNRIYLTNDAEAIKQISKHLIGTRNLQREKLATIVTAIGEISASVQSRTPKEGLDEITFLCYNIICQVEFEMGKVRGIDVLKEKLGKTGDYHQDNVEEKVNTTFDAIEKILITNENKFCFRQKLDNTKRNYVAKCKIKSLISELKQFSVQQDDPMVRKMFDDICQHIDMKKAKKQDLDQKFDNKEWDECIKIIENLRNTYEIFLNTVKKLLGNENTGDVSAPFKDFFTSIFKGSAILKTLIQNVDIILQNNEKELQAMFMGRLKILSELIYNVDTNFGNKCNEDKEFQAGVEMLVLDLSEILETLSLFGDNRLFLDKHCPLLIGKALRNYLAHGDCLISALPFDPSAALMSTAIKFLNEGENLLVNRNRVIGVKVFQDRSSFICRYKRNLGAIVVQNKMFSACKVGSIEEVKDCIANGADLYAKDFEGWAGIHFASMGGNLDALLFLLEISIDINSRTNLGQSILHIAALYGSNNVIKFILDQKHMSIDDTDYELFTPLLYAASYGHVNVVHTLLENSADIECSDIQGMRALHMSANNGHGDVVQVLLDNNAKIDSLSNSKMTPLHYAAFNNHLDIIAMLVEKGAVADISVNNIPMLHFALSLVQKDVVLSLLENGADVNVLSGGNCTALHMAARYGQSEIVSALLMRDADISATNIDNWTPLHYAAIHEHVDVAKLLLDNGANPNSITVDHRTPLHFACSVSQKETVEYLLLKGADIECVSDEFWTPLLYAANNNRVDILKVLLDKGANVNAVNKNKQGAIHWAAFGGFKDVVYELLDRGADVNIVDDNKQSPLHFASYNKHKDIIEALLSYGADVNAMDEDNKTALYWATLYGSEDIVNVLRSRGALDDHDMKSNRTALLSAAVLGHNDVVKSLLESCSCDQILTDDNKFSALHLAAGKGHVETVKSLLNSGIQIDLTVMDGMTPLHMACLKGENDVVKVLLAKGANIEAVSSTAITSALHWASVNGHLNVVETLLKNGANVNVPQEDSFTALHLAAQSGHHYVAKVLIEKGANLNAQSSEGFIPLHYATLNRYKDVVDVLLEFGAGINIQTRRGFTPLHISSSLGDDHIVDSLLEAGADINIADTLHRSPLIYATVNNHKTVVERLLKVGADLSVPDDNNMTPLHYAARDGNTAVVDIILKKRPFVDSVDKNGFTPLIYATRNGHKKIIQMLLLEGADTNSADKNGVAALHYSARSGWPDILEILIEMGANIEACDKDSWTPLFYSVHGGHIKIVEILIQKGANFNSIDTNKMRPLDYAIHLGHKDIVDLITNKKISTGGSFNDIITELHVAANTGQIEVVNALIAEKVDVNARDLTGWTPLMYASHQGHVHVVQTLIQAGGNVDATNDDGNTSLHFAAIQGHVDVASELVLKATNVNMHNNKNMVPLILAAYNGHASIVTTLLDKGANVDYQKEDGSTALHLASSKGHNDVVCVLLLHGANIDVRTNESCSPLYVALSNGHKDVVFTLLENGANVNVPTKDNSTALHMDATSRHPEIVEALIDHGAHVNAVNDDGFMALHYAANNGDIETCSILLIKGANVNGLVTNQEELTLVSTDDQKGNSPSGVVRNKDIGTPLHLALRSGHKDVSVALMENGADVLRQTKNHVTTLHEAVVGNISELLKLLIGKVNDIFDHDRMKLSTYINTKDIDGDTPLMWAAEIGLTEPAKLLIEYGAEIDARNNSLMTALHWAVMKGHRVSVMLLIEYNANVYLKDSNGKTALDLALERMSDLTDNGEEYTVIAALVFSVTYDDVTNGSM